MAVFHQRAGNKTLATSSDAPAGSSGQEAPTFLEPGLLCDLFRSKGAEMPSHKALLVVDVQYDFIDGSLAVKDAAQIIEPTVELIRRGDWDLIVATQDYHPANHVSFASTHARPPFTLHRVPHPYTASRGGAGAGAGEGVGEGETVEQMMWPDHCVQGTRGAQIHHDVLEAIDERRRRDGVAVETLQKGQEVNVDSYSGFSLNHYLGFTRLVRLLHQSDVRDVTVVGLATDYCVGCTALDARKFGFPTTLVRACVRGVDAAASARELRTLEAWGARVVDGVEEAI